MEQYSFFNSVNGDRRYDASDLAEFFLPFFTNGIFNNGLKVTADEGMKINIATGRAYCNGHRYINKDTVLTKTIDIADGEQSRIDNVVLRVDETNRTFTCQIVKGSYSSNPVAPSLVRDTTTYDLRLATISVPAGVTEITDDLIKDCRFNSDDCGNVVQAVQTIDTTNIFAQYEAKFNELFNQMKGILSEDSAGQLLVEINNVKNKVNNILPIGTIIANDDDDFDPNLLYEGTWERIKGYMLIGRDEDDEDFATSGLTGGSKTHTMTLEELVKHHHVQNLGGELSTVANVPGDYIIGKMNTSDTYDTGETKPMNIMNPYYVANIWRRVA